jgi:hypothetical protein
MELTTLDPLGIFYLVTLDEDRDIRTKNVVRQNTICARPMFAQQPPMYNANAQAASIASYNIKVAQFEMQQRVRANLHSAIYLS